MTGKSARSASESDTAFRDRKHFHWRGIAGLVAAAICFTLAAAIVAHYPLAPLDFGTALLVYALALWRWPALWLAVIPAMLPSFDLTPWTGWTQLGEPDLFILVTIGVLALRTPLRLADFRLEGLVAAVVVLSLISYLSSIALGLALPGPEGGSDKSLFAPRQCAATRQGVFHRARTAAVFAYENAHPRRCDGLVWHRHGGRPCDRLPSGAGRARRLHQPFRLHDRLPGRRHLLQHEYRWWPHRCLHRDGPSFSARLPAAATPGHTSGDVRHRDRRRLRRGRQLRANRLRRSIDFDARRWCRLGMGGAPSKYSHCPGFCAVGSRSADDQRHPDRRSWQWFHGKAVRDRGFRAQRSRRKLGRRYSLARRGPGQHPSRQRAGDLSAHCSRAQA